MTCEPVLLFLLGLPVESADRSLARAVIGWREVGVDEVLLSDDPVLSSIL